MKYRQIMNLLWISIPMCVLLRVIQIMFTLDDATGFMKQQYSKISVLISFVVCAATIAVAALASTAENIEKREKSISPVIALTCLLTGGMFVYEMVASVSVLGVGRVSGSILIVLAFLSALVFIAYGLKNIYDYQFPSIALIVPAVYYIAKLINLFVSTSALALVTKNVFMLLANSALLLFMFEFASFENNFKGKAQKPKRIFAIGVGTIMVCLVAGLPTIVAAIIQKTELLKGDVATAALMITQAVFIFSYISGNFHKKETKPRPQSKHSA